VKVDELEEEQRILAMAKHQKPVEFGSKDDFQLAQALNHFKGLPVKLAKIDTPAEKRAEAMLVKPEVKSDIKPEDKKAPARK
jgi:carboxyl-terminal processing protease